MSRVWNQGRAKTHIDQKIESVKTVTIKTYGRDMSLENIPSSVAYRVDAVHMYVDIQNIGDILNVTEIEGELCHKRTLRFLDQHYRAIRRILDRVEAKRVDIHNTRLHSLFTKPYNSEAGAEKKRIQKAVATAQLLIDVLAQTKDDDKQIPAAKLRVGIDTGETLAVNNGRNGNREPLFLGDAANHAAKLASNSTPKGIYLTNAARKVLGLAEQSAPEKVALTKDEIEDCCTAANLGVSADKIVEEWRDDLAKNPLSGYEFTRHTPPLSTIDIEDLTPGNSRRQEAISIYADIDGFTSYVASNIKNNAEDVVRVLHVLRAELERVLSKEFEGRRVRFIGDCVHGLFCEGTSAKTDEPKTVSNATLLAGAFRSSFNLAIERLKASGYATGNLGLSIGFELGPMTLTRLGVKADRIRCSISRGVLRSESEQCRCKGNETAIGPVAYNAAPDSVQKLFGTSRKRTDLDYTAADEALNPKDESKKNNSSLLKPATAASAGFTFKAAAEPSRTLAGFS